MEQANRLALREVSERFVGRHGLLRGQCGCAGRCHTRAQYSTPLKEERAPCLHRPDSAHERFSSGLETDVLFDIELACVPRPCADHAETESVATHVETEARVVHEPLIEADDTERAVTRLFHPRHDVHAIAQLRIPAG